MKILPLAAIELLSLHNSLAQSKPVPRGVDNLKKNREALEEDSQRAALLDQCC